MCYHLFTIYSPSVTTHLPPLFSIDWVLAFILQRVQGLPAEGTGAAGEHHHVLTAQSSSFNGGKCRGKKHGMGQNLVPLVNIKIAGKWMFIPLKMVLIGIDPQPYHGVFLITNLAAWAPDVAVHQLIDRRHVFRTLSSHTDSSNTWDDLLQAKSCRKIAMSMAISGTKLEVPPEVQEWWACDPARVDLDRFTMNLKFNPSCNLFWRPKWRECAFLTSGWLQQHRITFYQND